MNTIALIIGYAFLVIGGLALFLLVAFWLLTRSITATEGGERMLALVYHIIDFRTRTLLDTYWYEREYVEQLGMD